MLLEQQLFLMLEFLNALFSKKKKTNHKSVGGLRIYERVTEDQEKMVSKILSRESKKFTEESELDNREETKPCAVRT